MTAFILFALATAEVKGFAFTLGIGVLVSLFTAVLATQAALGAMGRSKLVTHPAALGAAANERKGWTFDFMGASRWFFSLSGTILLIGALAIGGKGLNFGIDFKSGTRIQTAFVKHVNESEVAQRDGRSSATATRRSRSSPDAERRRQRLPDLDQDAQAERRSKRVEDELEIAQVRRKHKHFSSTSIGPTFGKTVANSAVIAIIASLLVISAYIALRFEWKYAVPVLIALMHDLLITAGVYSLTGREVTTATVAALLTILGYSLYDTIIVFDRVRENVPTHAEGRLLADRQPLDVRGADPIAGDELLHAAAGPRAAALRRRNAEGLRLRADDRHRLGRLLVDLHRLAGADALEGARARPTAPARADRPRPRRRAGLRDHGRRRAGGRRAGSEEQTGRRGRLTAPEEPGQQISRDEFQELVADLDVDAARAAAARPPRAGRHRGAARARAPSPSRPQRDPAADLTPEDLVLKDAPKPRPEEPPAAQQTPREGSLMGMLGWVMMGLAIWHFTIFLPDRFWGGIVGAFVGSLVGSIIVGLIIFGDQRLRAARSRAKRRPTSPSCSTRSRGP